MLYLLTITIEGKNIFYSVKDRQAFKDKNILIAGGGDSALDYVLGFKGIAKSINLLHKHNIVHGDLHNQNIMFLDDLPRLIDFSKSIINSTKELLQKEKDYIKWVNFLGPLTLELETVLNG